MRHLRLVALFSSLTFSLVLVSAHAQDDTSDLTSRLDRIERDVSFLQKQVYRDGGGAPGTAASGSVTVQLSQINEEIRQLRGSIEQTQFANKQTATDLKKLSDDVDFRLRAIEEKQAAAAAAPAPVPAPVAAATTAAPAAPEAPAHFDPNETPDAPKKAAAAAPAAASATGADFPDSNAHYSYAFKLLSDKKYSEAAASFDAFVKKYPSDPLTSNAYYWLGESYYSRADYTRAIDSFRKGYEVNPAGQKAPDNLFKLGKSLSMVKRNNEACIVFAQIGVKYADASPRVLKRAEEERASLQCK